MKAKVPRILFAALFSLLIALGTVKKARSLGSPDFRVFYTAAQHVLHDPENMYRLSPDRYLYPPSTAIFLVPFAFTKDYSLHQWIWHGVLALIVFLFSVSGGAAFLALLLLVRYLAITFSYGQINLLILALLHGAAIQGERGRRKLSASLWALVSSIKIYPLVLAPFFLHRDRRKSISWAFFSGFLLLILPFLVFGPGTGASLYGEFLGALRDKGLPLHSHNQSISALFLRLLTKEMFYLHAVGPAWWGWVDLPKSFVRLLALSVGLLLATLSWRRAFRNGLSAATSLSAASFSILFFSHIVWKDYFLLLLFPLMEGFSVWPKRTAFSVAAAVFALTSFSSPDFLQALFGWAGEPFARYWLTERATIGHALSVRFDAACIHLWIAIIIWWAWVFPGRKA